MLEKNGTILPYNENNEYLILFWNYLPQKRSFHLEQYTPSLVWAMFPLSSMRSTCNICIMKYWIQIFLTKIGPSRMCPAFSLRVLAASILSSMKAWDLVSKWPLNVYSRPYVPLLCKLWQNIPTKQTFCKEQQICQAWALTVDSYRSQNWHPLDKQLLLVILVTDQASSQINLFIIKSSSSG